MASQVVDFDALVATSPDADAGSLVEHLSTPGSCSERCSGDGRGGVVLADEGAAVDVAVVDIASASRRSATAEPRRARRSRPNGPTGRPRPPQASWVRGSTTAATAVTAAVAPARPPRATRGAPTTPRDDDRGHGPWATGVEAVDVRRRGASRSFGGRSRGGRAGNRRPRTEWGIQLDAEVDEPTAHAAGAPEAAGDGSVPPEPAHRARPGRDRAGRAGSSGARGEQRAILRREYEDPSRPLARSA